MCPNGHVTAYNLIVGIEPTLISLMKLLNIPATQQQQVIDAYNAAALAVKNWVPGTTATTIVQAVQAADDIFQTLPIPDADKALAGIITAGFTTVIAIIEANSPVPIPTGTGGAAPTTLVVATPEEVQVQHQIAVAHAATAKVQTLVPDFKRSIWHSPASQFKSTWNAKAKELGHPELVQN